MTPAGLIRALATFLRRYPDDPVAWALFERLSREPRPEVRGGSPRVLIQCVEDRYYLGLFGLIGQALRSRADVTLDLFVHTSFNKAIGADWKTSLLRSFPLQRLSSNQWVRLYASISDRVGYRSTSLRHPAGDDIDAVRSWTTWRGLASIDALEQLHIDEIHVGDLVIDSYLRFRPSPRTRIDDPFVLYLIWQAHRDVRRARRYFRAARPHLYLTSYTTYIQHGVATRVALDEGTAVLSFGNLQEFGKRLSREDPFHTRNPLGYRRDFARLDRPDERRAAAQRELEVRLSGGVDSATAYMASSAYAGGGAPIPDVRGAVVVFLHDFYDSPHVYADLVFPDFWAWICATLDTLDAAGVRYFVKPHPNQIALSGAVLDDLRARYPGLPLLPPGVTNRQLVEGGIVCAVTMYGTVAHEMAYFGIPSVACARHPHVAFDFCRTAADRATYARYLREAPSMRTDRALRRQALEFYYMHNLALEDRTRALRDANVAAWRACNVGPISSAEVLERFEELARQPGFSDFIEETIDAHALRDR